MRSATDKEQIRCSYEAYAARKYRFVIFLVILLSVMVVIATNLGSVSLGYRNILHAIGNRLFPTRFDCSEVTATIIWELRLPGIFMGILVGAGLAVAGTTMQVILRNPLASPYTLGMASAAGFGAALSLVGHMDWGGKELWSIVNAFFFSLLSSFLVLGLSKLRRISPAVLILSGIAMMFLFSALTSLLQYLGTSEEVTAVVFWLMGSLSRTTWPKVAMVAAVVLSSLTLLFKFAWDFNVLSTGDETAKSFGVDAGRLRILALSLASLVTAASICFVGTIAFIGLVAPHIARMIVGGDHRFLLPASGLIGAVLLLVADTAARTILSPVILPVGILTSFLGVPLFVYLIIKRRREYW